MRNISIQATLFQEHKKTAKIPLDFIHKKQLEDSHTLELPNAGPTPNRQAVRIHKHRLSKETIEAERMMDRNKIEDPISSLST